MARLGIIATSRSVASRRLSIRIALAHQHAARERQRAIEPGVVNHAAVGLGVQAQRLARTVKLGTALTLNVGESLCDAVS